MNRRLGYGVVGVGLLALTGISGCATPQQAREYARQEARQAATSVRDELIRGQQGLERRYDTLDRRVGELAGRVMMVETKPTGVERAIYLTLADGREKGYATELARLIEFISSQYKDIKLGWNARIYGNAVPLSSTGLRDKYRAVVVWDDGDNKLTEGDAKRQKGDITLHDVQEGKIVDGFIIDRKDIPKKFLDMLIDVKTPAHSRQVPQQTSKPFIRKEPLYIRRHVRYPVKR